MAVFGIGEFHELELRPRERQMLSDLAAHIATEAKGQRIIVGVERNARFYKSVADEFQKQKASLITADQAELDEKAKQIAFSVMQESWLGDIKKHPELAPRLRGLKVPVSFLRAARDLIWPLVKHGAVPKFVNLRSHKELRAIEKPSERLFMEAEEELRREVAVPALQNLLDPDVAVRKAYELGRTGEKHAAYNKFLLEDSKRMIRRWHRLTKDKGGIGIWYVGESHDPHARYLLPVMTNQSYHSVSLFPQKPARWGLSSSGNPALIDRIADAVQMGHHAGTTELAQREAAKLEKAARRGRAAK